MSQKEAKLASQVLNLGAQETYFSHAGKKPTTNPPVHGKMFQSSTLQQTAPQKFRRVFKTVLRKLLLPTKSPTELPKRQAFNDVKREKGVW